MTRQPRKQRTQTRNAPLHERHDQVRATLDSDLREEHGQRNVRVNAGDTVRIAETRPLSKTKSHVVVERVGGDD